MKSSEIKRILKDVFPELEVPWLRDEEYDLPTLEEVQFFLKTDEDWQAIKKRKFEDITFDCDDFALQLHAAVKRKYHWALGEAFGDRIKGIYKLHNQNVWLREEDELVYMLEPQTDEIWQAVKGEDNIRIVGM